MKKYIVKENGETVGVFLSACQACALNDEYMKFGRICTIDIVNEPEETETETNEQEETEMKNAEFIATLNAVLATAQNRSAWDRGVQEYAEEIAEEIAEGISGGYIALDDLRTREGAQSAMLNGASTWSEYSWGGSSLIYDCDIARRLCTPSELKKCRDGKRRPNSREEWLDCQARALAQAYRRVYASIRETFRQLDG